MIPFYSDCLMRLRKAAEMADGAGNREINVPKSTEYSYMMNSMSQCSRFDSRCIDAHPSAFVFLVFLVVLVALQLFVAVKLRQSKRKSCDEITDMHKALLLSSRGSKHGARAARRSRIAPAAVGQKMNKLESVKA